MKQIVTQLERYSVLIGFPLLPATGVFHETRILRHNLVDRQGSSDFLESEVIHLRTLFWATCILSNRGIVRLPSREQGAW